MAEGVVSFDARKPFALEDGSVEFIYCSHLLEHLESWEARFFLKECNRIIEPAGTMRIAVPDLDLIIEKYLARDEEFFTDPVIAGHSEEEIERYYRNSSYLTLTDLFLGTFYSSEFFRKMTPGYHRYAYNLEVLNSRALEAGFDGATRMAWAESSDADIVEFEKAQAGFYESFSLYVEMRKSG